RASPWHGWPGRRYSQPGRSLAALSLRPGCTVTLKSSSRCQRDWTRESSILKARGSARSATSWLVRVQTAYFASKPGTTGGKSMYCLYPDEIGGLRIPKGQRLLAPSIAKKSVLEVGNLVVRAARITTRTTILLFCRRMALPTAAESFGEEYARDGSLAPKFDI